MKGMDLPKMSTVNPFHPKYRTASDEQCPNILKQRFDPSEPNKVWVCDFTYAIRSSSLSLFPLDIQ